MYKCIRRFFLKKHTDPNIPFHSIALRQAVFDLKNMFYVNFPMTAYVVASEVTH